MNTSTAILIVLTFTMTVSAMEESYAAAEVAAPSLYERFLPANWWTWDRQNVKVGLFKNENIMIGVGQALFNFVFSTLAWFTVSQIYSLTAAVNPASTPREMRSISLEQAAEEVLDAITAFENKQKTE